MNKNISCYLHFTCASKCIILIYLQYGKQYSEEADGPFDPRLVNKNNFIKRTL